MPLGGIRAHIVNGKVRANQFLQDPLVPSHQLNQDVDAFGETRDTCSSTKLLKP